MYSINNLVNNRPMLHATVTSKISHTKLMHKNTMYYISNIILCRKNTEKCYIILLLLKIQNGKINCKFLLPNVTAKKCIMSLMQSRKHSEKLCL